MFHATMPDDASHTYWPYWDQIKTGIIDPGYPSYIVSAPPTPLASLPNARWARWVSAANFANATNMANFILGMFNQGAAHVIVNEISAPYAQIIRDCNMIFYANPAYMSIVSGRLTFYVAHQETGMGSWATTLMRDGFFSAWSIGCGLAVEQYPRARWWCNGEASGGMYTRDPYLLNYFLGKGYGNTWGQGSPYNEYGFSYLIDFRNGYGFGSLPINIVFGVGDNYAVWGAINPGDFIKRLHAVWNRYTGFASFISAASGGAGAWNWRPADMTTTSRDQRFVEAFNTYSVGGSIALPSLTC